MTSDKQILRIRWKANKLTVILALVSVCLCSYGLKQFEEAYVLSIYLFAAIQIAISTLAILFFYGGISRTDKYQALMALLSCTFIYSLVANLVSQSFMFLGSFTMSLLMDLYAMVTVNVCAILTTLTFARLEKVSVERDMSKKSEKPSKLEACALATNPFITSSVILLIALVMGLNPPSILENNSFCITMAFFFWVQMGTTLILTNTFFPDYKGNPKWRVFFSILSLALLIGAISNHAHDQITTRVGNRIDMNAITFVIMNTGALLTVLTFHMWKDYLNTLKSRFEPGKD